MKNPKTPEMFLIRAYNSPKLKKLAIVLVCAMILIFVILLLPPVQNMLYSFVNANISRKGSGRTFDSRLQSLLSLPFFGLLAFIFALCCVFSKKITSFLENARNRKLITTASAGIGALLLCYLSVFSYQLGWQWLNSDPSSEMVLGKLLAEENTFVSRNWHYSTEIRIIYQTLFTMPLFKLLGKYENWALIRALGILLNHLVLVLSYLFMVMQLRIQKKWIGITTLFLILPISTSYWGMVTFGGFYIFFIAQLFCCLGLFINLINHSSRAKRVLPGFILFTALSFAFGIQGIRALLCVHIPLFITCIYLFSKDEQKKIFPLFLGCYGLVVCCIGFAANYLLHFWYSFLSFEGMRLENLFVQFFPKLGQSFVALAEFFGLSVGSSLLSAHGLFSVIALTGTFFLFWAVFKSFRQFQIQDDSADKSVEYKFMPTFFSASVILNIIVFIIVDQAIAKRYFVPFMVLYVPLVAVLFQYTEKRYSYLKRTALITGITLFIFGQSYLFIQNMARRDVNTTRKGYIQYLLDNRLDYGFATYWNANVTTELSNGKIEMVGLVPIENLAPPYKDHQLYFYKWLIPAKFENPYYHQGESFLLLTRSEWEMVQQDGRSFTQLPPDYEDSDYIIIRYQTTETVYFRVLDNL